MTQHIIVGGMMLTLMMMMMMMMMILMMMPHSTHSLIAKIPLPIEVKPEDDR